jgi:hypothetical protein
VIRFIHTADWQIGKSYRQVSDEQKRFRLQQERLSAIGRIRARAPHGRKAVALHRSAFAVVSTTRSVCFPHTDTDPVNTYESCETQTAVIS